MSLLMKALQQAAKSRDDGTPAAGTNAEPAPGTTAGDLQLEPIESARAPVPARPNAADPDIGEEPEAGSPRTRAATVLQAAADSRPQSGPIEYIRNHPLVAISTVAGLFMIGYGGYIYLQITNPGMFASRGSNVAKPAAAPAAATKPIAPAPGAVGQVPSSPPAPAPAPSAVATPPTQAPAQAPSSNVEALPPPITSATSAVPVPAVPAAGTTGTTTPVPAGTPAGAPVPPGPAPAPSTATSGIPATQPPMPTTGPGSKPAPAANSPTPATVPPSAVAIPAAPIVVAPPPAKVETRVSAPSASRTVSSSASDVPPRAPATSVARPVPRAAPPAESPAVRAASTPAAVDPTLLSAHQALESARFDDARRLYQSVLASQPNDVDALLGLATIAVQQGRPDQATSQYARILELDPRNATAQAGLLGLVGRADPLAAELRLRQLISRESAPAGGTPVQAGASAASTAFLQFTLGNVHAEQNQWAQAQSAYFQAHNLQPDNPDYAFNLAVGLERLSQPKIALGFYRKAVELARSRGHASFDVTVAEGRIRKLEQAPAQ